MKIFKTLEILLKIIDDCVGNPVTLSFLSSPQISYT